MISIICNFISAMSASYEQDYQRAIYKILEAIFDIAFLKIVILAIILWRMP